MNICTFCLKKLRFTTWARVCLSVCVQLDGIDDPTELLSYLGPSADTAGAGIGGSSNPDDLLSLFT